ncbi:dephospho-CoA kinase, partial [Clostridium sp. HCS.1]|uniref:dephospho-CoA kinase n=1 Tax=Clostridium sp. HCS.1 TaxID=3238594 RepID=UPI003A102D42
MDNYEKAGEGIIILDAPTLIENDLHTFMDYKIVVWVDNNTQVIRLKNRDRLSREEAINRMNAQLS